MIYKFFILMGISSTLTLVRGFVVASLLSIDDFGIFVVLVAIGTFSSTLLGLGQIEGTMKAFPRAWSSGMGKQICNVSDTLTHKIIGRTVVAVILAGVIFYSTDHVAQFVMVGMVAGVSIGAAMMGIYASILRASGNLKQLGRSTFIRSFLALIFCVIGAFTIGWYGAVIGEFLAAILGALQARYAGRRLIKLEEISDDRFKDAKPLFSESFSGGRWLLIAMLAMSVPVYLDRLFIATFFDSSVAGQYGFLMLFVTGAATFAGIIVQKIGPELVKGSQINVRFYSMHKTVGLWIVVHIISVIFGIGLFSVLTFTGPLNFLGERYQLSCALILVTLMIASMQCSVIFDWILLSRDQERLVFVAAIVYLSIVFMFALLVVFAKANVLLIDLMVCMALAKFVHILCQLLMIKTKIRIEKIVL